MLVLSHGWLDAYRAEPRLCNLSAFQRYDAFGEMGRMTTNHRNGTPDRAAAASTRFVLYILEESTPARMMLVQMGERID